MSGPLLVEMVDKGHCLIIEADTEKDMKDVVETRIYAVNPS